MQKHRPTTKHGLIEKYALTKIDIAAAAVFLALGALLIWSARYAAVYPDEAYYYTVAERFFQGDRLLVEEWSLMQLFTVFILLPFRVFTAVTGSTDGVILFMRFAYVAFDLFLFQWFYRKLRGQGAVGLFAATMLCFDIYAGILSLNYYNLCFQCLAVTAVVLFFAEKQPSPGALVGAGIALSCAVVSEPLIAIIYLIHTVLVAVRESGKKKGVQRLASIPYAFDGRTWLFLTVGVAVSAAAFLTFLLATSGLKNIIAMIPEMLTDSEYGMRWYGNEQNITKIPKLLEAFGIPGVALSLLTPVAAAVGMKLGKGQKTKRILFFCAVCVLILCFGRAMIHGFHMVPTAPDSPESVLRFTPITCFKLTFQCIDFPVVTFALTCMILCGMKDKRMTVFWTIGILCSVCVDYLSDITFLYGGRFAWLPAAHCTSLLLRELKPEKKKLSVKKAAEALTGIALALILCWYVFAMAGHSYMNLRLHTSLGAKIETIDAGPLRGIRNNNGFNFNYSLVLSDLKQIQRENGVFYVTGMYPYMYLYPGLREGIHTSYFVEKDKVIRPLRYWELYPEKRPTHIYIPYYVFDSESFGDEENPNLQANKELVCSWGETEVVTGAAGYIIKMLSWDI
ncbi:MAG: hypothetical protein IJK23_03985 [Clostridia bacterium]|nr:hypothetical protein [Clostridia bacterium]